MNGFMHSEFGSKDNLLEAVLKHHHKSNKTIRTVKLTTTTLEVFFLKGVFRDVYEFNFRLGCQVFCCRDVIKKLKTKFPDLFFRTLENM